MQPYLYVSVGIHGKDVTTPSDFEKLEAATTTYLCHEDAGESETVYAFKVLHQPFDYDDYTLSKALTGDRVAALIGNGAQFIPQAQDKLDQIGLSYLKDKVGVWVHVTEL